jgi:hypothetical protein
LFWLSQGGNRETVATVREKIAAGKDLTEEQIRAELSVRKRSA